MGWIVPWSGGKDSTATIIVMLENNIQIDKIVHVRMMATETIPATHQVMTDFVDDCIARFQSLGLNVELVKSKPFDLYASRIFKRSKYKNQIGMTYGFTDCSRGMCSFQKEKTRLSGGLNNGNTMLGICYDEPQRMREGRKSILFEKKITQKMAFDLCKQRGLLSPLYALGCARDGCFFCPNARKREQELLNKTQLQLISKWVQMTPKRVKRNFDWRWHLNEIGCQMDLFKNATNELTTEEK